MSGTKYDQGKPDLTLLDRTAMEEVAIVLGFGEKKYGRYNWRRGIDKERLLAASLRHIMASNDGEIKDPESGRSHLAHAICGLMFALHFEIKQREETWVERIDFKAVENAKSILSETSRENSIGGDL